MSLDATILHVAHDGADLVLSLGPRIDWEEKLSPVGQPQVRIVEATWTPEPGMDLWGDACSAFIAPRLTLAHEYRREGYTRLYEVRR